jgi:hypothetical protein
MTCTHADAPTAPVIMQRWELGLLVTKVQRSVAPD